MEHRGKAVANGHERSIKPQVSGQMAPAAMLDVKEITAEANCRAASGSLSTDQSLLAQAEPSLPSPN
jgi:hypothetical protein